ncbi:MAG: hypothetical protein ACLFPQ_06010 [Candidatus Woesearchaeota archaeon]
MVLDFVTGLVSYEPTFAGENILFVFMAALLIIMGVLAVLTSLIIFIISCFKHSIRLDCIFDPLMSDFKKIYREIFRYYFLITTVNLIPLLTYIMFPFIREQILYYSITIVSVIATIFLLMVINSSTAKSYYRFIKTKKFSFTLITGKQFFTLLFANLLYFFLILGGLVVFVFPAIILGLIFPFIKYPIIVENKGFAESIQRGVQLFRKEFWNMVFYVGLYSLLISALNSVTNTDFIYLNIIGLVINSLFIIPLGIFLMTIIYEKIENAYLEDNFRSRKTQKSKKQFLSDMKKIGYREKQIKDAKSNNKEKK